MLVKVLFVIGQVVLAIFTIICGVLIGGFFGAIIDTVFYNLWVGYDYDLLPAFAVIGAILGLVEAVRWEQSRIVA